MLSRLYKPSSLLVQSYRLPVVRAFSSLPSNTDKKKAIDVDVPDMTKNKERMIDTIYENTGMFNYMKKVYLYTGGALVGGLSTSILLEPLAIQNPGLFTIGGLITGISSGIALSLIKGVVKNKPEGKVMENSPVRIFCYGTAIASMGAMISPFISVMNGIDPSIFSTSLVLTTGVFGGASMFAYMAPKYSLSPYLGPMIGGLWGLVGIGLTSVGAQYFGYTQLGDVLHNINTYGGLCLFTGLLAVDTHVAMTEYDKGNPDHLETSYMFYLDTINILIRIMTIMAQSKKN
jgi:FtsH-binding integral membrane protein